MEREDVEIVIYMQDEACMRDIKLGSCLDEIVDKMTELIEEYKKSPYYFDGRLSLYESIDNFLVEYAAVEQLRRKFRESEGYYE